tara:strand:+ start:1134 stop:1253 length:120 start_codon:yes stop_codon:yes gene_type:complete
VVKKWLKVVKKWLTGGKHELSGTIHRHEKSDSEGVKIDG